MIVEQIKAAIDSARPKKQQTAMFHLQVLINAHELEGVDGAEFSKEVGLAPSFKTEFDKMIALARLIKQLGKKII